MPLPPHGGPRRRLLTLAVGERNQAHRRHLVRLSRADAALRRTPRPRGGVTMPTIAADPYPWPFDGDLTPQNTALMIIDMQTDFCGKGGYVDAMGYDLPLTRAPIEPIRTALPAPRPTASPLF